MSIVRIKKNHNYTIIDNTSLNDSTLSWGAKGLLAYLISKPDDWQIYIKQLEKISTDGRDSTSSKLNELISQKYIVKKTTRENGQFKGYNYDVYEKPIKSTISPNTENPNTENPQLLITDINKLLSKDNKESSKKTLSWEKSSDLTKNIINIFYSSLKKIKPKIKKNTFHNENEIYKVEKLINNYIKGFNKVNYNKLRHFISEKNINFNINIGFHNENEFIKIFNNAMLIYNIDFYPENKTKLPSKTSDFLLNQFMNWPSYFIYYGFFPPKKLKIEVKKRKDRYPEITKLYTNTFKLINLSIENTNKLIVFIDKLINEYKKITQKTIIVGGKKYIRHEYEDHPYLLYMNDIDSFFENHIDYLKSNTELNQKFTMNINKLFVGGYWWNQFVDWYARVYEINLYPSEEELIQKCTLFLN